jgi:4-aminobutyrate aminotransferase
MSAVLNNDNRYDRCCRAGKWWAYKHASSETDPIKPDMLIFGKGIASGFPVAGVALNPELIKHMEAGALGGTYGGSTLACSALQATIEVIESEGLIRNARERGEQLMQGLRDCKERYSWPIKDIRGRGLMLAMEFEGKAAIASEVQISRKFPKTAVCVT